MLENLNILEKNMDKLDKKLIRILCPFFKYEKSSRFELFIGEDSELKIKLNCHNHILSAKTYFNYFFKNAIIPKNNSCVYHTKKLKSVAYCFKCSNDICQNCLTENHSSHGIQNYSNASENSEVIKNEYNNILKQIPIIKESIQKICDFNRERKKYLETIFFLYFIKKIVYEEYLDDLKTETFSFACLMNLEYIRSKSWNISFENGLNWNNIEILFTHNKKLKQDYFVEKENIIYDNGILYQEKINLKN